MYNNILIAEDVKVNRIILRRFIERYFDENINIYEAENGLEAINIFMDIHPDLIFMDLCMPNFDGIDAIDIIRKIEEKNKLKQTDIIIISAIPEKEINNICCKYNIKNYLLKPLEYSHLKSILDYYHLKEERIE